MTEKHEEQGSGGLLTHDEARAELSAWLDGEQPVTLAVPLAEHLAGCAACQGWQQAWACRAREAGPDVTCPRWRHRA